jgi:hypothetical protein
MQLQYSSDSEMMLDLLFYTVEQDANNMFAFNVVHYSDNEKVVEQQGPDCYWFTGDPMIITFSKDKKHYTLESIVYRSNGFLGCEIGKDTIGSIFYRFGKPARKEFENKYVYRKDGKTITFFFDGGMLTNIMFNPS